MLSGVLRIIMVSSMESRSPETASAAAPDSFSVVIWKTFSRSTHRNQPETESELSVRDASSGQLPNYSKKSMKQFAQFKCTHPKDSVLEIKNHKHAMKEPFFMIHRT